MHQTLNRSKIDKFTFWQIFARQEAKEYEENPITHSNITHWRNLLAEHDDTIKKIKIIRDTKIAHSDIQSEGNFIALADLRKLLLLIEIIILDMLSILGCGQEINKITTYGDCHTIADAFKFIEVNLQYQLLSKKFGPKSSTLA